MSRNLGGQKRHIHCDCGKAFVGHPTEVNKMFMRHQLKYCPNRGEKEVYVPSKFNSGDNGVNGIVCSKQGNYTHKPSVGSVIENGVCVGKLDGREVQEVINKRSVKNEIEDKKV
jgi:hypothetical protein